MKIIPKFDQTWNSTKGRYDIHNKMTGELVNDTIISYLEAKEKIAELNREARVAAGVPDEIELPSDYYGTRNRDKIEVGTPVVHK